MAIVTKTININAPVEKIYSYIQVPNNLLEIWPSMIEVKDIQPLPNGGNKYGWVYKMAGMRFEGLSEDTEIVTNQRAVSKTEGGIDSEITWEFQQVEEGTNVSLKAEYTVPIPLIGKLAEAAIVKLNDNEGDAILANLKARMET
ncbi:SRPBCC family protein [Chloroflexota bacterium]